VVQLDPLNRYALVNLQKLYEDQHQWAEAAGVREAIARIDTAHRPEDQQILGFLRNQIGTAAADAGDSAAAAKTFEEAIDLDPRTAPAYLNLGDMRERQGHLPAAIAAWERLVDLLPDRAYLAFDRLERAYRTTNTAPRFAEMCRRLIDRNPNDWRARLALSRHLAALGEHRAAFDLLLAALPHNPHGLAIHQEIWQALTGLGLDPDLVTHYVTLTREAVFYLDPHVCTSCRYRSTGLLWQCPQCHEWNTFVEERLAPAQDGAADVMASEP
jgi:lipopolysaccharide biosynthesis regulator YciM